MDAPAPINLHARGRGHSYTAIPRNHRVLLARRFKKRGRGHSIHLNIIPLVDVTFLLMIFFVIAGTFKRWEGILSSRIFPADSTLSVPLPISPVTLRLQSTGVGPDAFHVAVDGTTRQTRDFDELAGILLELQKNPAYSRETPVVILSDPRIRWDHVMNAWNAAVRSGYKNVAFGST
jgi:biopolymer transport protein ExbD